MGAVPKKKLAKARTRKRRGALRIKIPQLTKCQTCKKEKLPHTVCPFCGHYRGKEIIQKESETKVIKA